MLRSEEEPVLPPCPGCFSLLQIRAEWRDSGSWANHDDGSLRILWQVKVFCDAREDGDGHVIGAFCKKGGADSFAQPTMTFVTDDVHNEMHLVGVRPQTRGHRIKPRLQFREQGDKLFRREASRRMLRKKS